MQKMNLPRLKPMRKEGQQFQTQGRSQLFRLPKDLDCEVCWMTKTRRARRRNILLNGVDGISHVTSLGDLVRADQTAMPRIKNWSPGCPLRARCFFRIGSMKSKDGFETACCLQRFMRPNQTPWKLLQTKSQEFVKAFQDLQGRTIQTRAIVQKPTALQKDLFDE